MIRSLFLAVLFLLCQTLSAGKKCSIEPQNLLCEYRTNPAGLDEPLPRFSWTLSATDADHFGQKQTAYRIIVSDNPKAIEKKEGNFWNSGWVTAHKMQLIAYNGAPVSSDRTYYWRVQVRDEKGSTSAWSPTAHFSTGILDDSEWSAKWIGSHEVYNPKDPDCNLFDPWLRKNITLAELPGRATLFVASVGYHELYVNGRKIGEEVLAPNVSDHTTRARYIAYDISKALRKGANTIALWLGTSWSVYPPYTVENRPRTPMVFAQAHLYRNANPEADEKPYLRIVTDNSWRVENSPNKLLGKWDFGNMGGELWDANREIADWNLPTFDDSRWRTATEYNPALKLSAQNGEGTRVYETIHPVSIEADSKGNWRVDMGVNFAGWTQIAVKGTPGSKIEFLFSEREKEEMTFNNHSAYIIGPSGKGTFRNRFNYSSGRWITIKGVKEKPQLSDISGMHLRTAFAPATTFACSDSLQNWIFNRVRWTFENLSIGGYIVDCPQRERLGYGGDAHATSETGLFNYKLGAFYTKWMEDWRDMQGWESMNGKRIGGGILPHTAPTNSGGGGPAWGGIVVTLPWLLYQHEGDTRILEKNFEMITMWLAFLDTHTQNDLLRRFGGKWDFLGDWLWPNATAEGMNNDTPQNACFNNCYRVFNLRTAAKIARVLGKNQEAEQWEMQAERSSRAIHETWYNADDHSYADKSMGNLAAALLADVPPVSLRESVWKRLEHEILVVRKGHIHVGITGGAILFKLLREKGRNDLIYSMTSQEDYPGWGYMRANGATTIWEMWEKDLPGHSLLHSSYLYPGAWYVDGVAGIRRDPDAPGFQQFIVTIPHPDHTPLNWARATYNGPAGTISTAWERRDGRCTMQITVPPNCEATLCLPMSPGEELTITRGTPRRIESQGEYTRYRLQAGRYLLTTASR